MIACITNKHTVLSSIGQLAAQILCIAHNSYLSKNMEGVKEHWAMLVEVAKWWILVDLGGQIFHLGCDVGTLGPQSLTNIFVLSGESSQVKH